MSEWTYKSCLIEHDRLISGGSEEGTEEEVVWNEEYVDI